MRVLLKETIFKGKLLTVVRKTVEIMMGVDGKEKLLLTEVVLLQSYRFIMVNLFL